MPGVFPTLKTGAVAQYPFTRQVRFETGTVRFLNHFEQAYIDRANVRKAWDLVYTELDDNEVATLKAFFVQQQGRFGTFSFTDPFDSVTYTTCSFGHDDFQHTQEQEGSSSVRFVIYEHV